MNRPNRGRQGRWGTTLIVGLLVAAIVMVTILSLQVAYATAVHRQVAESVLHDYARVAADEFIRRASVEVGYRGYFAAINELGHRVVAGPDGYRLEERDRGTADELVKTPFVLTTDGPPTASALDDETLRRLVAALDGQRAETEPPFRVVHLVDEAVQRTFILRRLAGDDSPVFVGFEVDLERIAPGLKRVVEEGPLLPASLGLGTPSNELLSIRVTDAAGRELFSSGDASPSALTARAEFGDTYNGILDGITVLTTIPPESADRLVIGGLPRSRLPLLLSLLLITVGLLVAAIVQLRRERALTRLRSDFVSRVSHELRTPLTQIRMFAETLLLGRVRGEDERERSLQIIDQESRRLGHLVENILTFSRSDRDALRVVPQPTDLAPLLDDVVQRFRPLAERRGVRVVTSLAAGVVASVDRDAVAQILLNLLDNALKYGPDGQTIRLCLDAEGPTVRISVEDRGPGVPARDRRRIWRRWQRLERDEQAAVAGSGIGLTVVRDLVVLHGGSVHIEDAPAGGARFVVEVPRSPS